MNDLTFVTLDELVDEIEKRAKIFAMVFVPKAQPSHDDGTMNYRTLYGYEAGNATNALIALANLGTALAAFVVENESARKDDEGGDDD